MPLTYTRPRGERPITLGNLATPGITSTLPPGMVSANRGPGIPASTTPGMSAGSATNPNLAPYAGVHGNTPTITGEPPPDDGLFTAPVRTDNDQYGGGGGGGGGGMGRAGYADPNGQGTGHAFSADQLARINSQVGQASGLFNSNPAQAAAILGSAGGGLATARDTAFAAQHFGGDMGAYRSWLQGQLTTNPQVQFNGTDFSGNHFGGAGMPGAGNPATGGPSGPSGGAPAVPGTQPPATLGGLAGGAPGSDSPGYGVNVQDFLDPSMQFRMNEGMRALENSAAGRGSLASGDTLRAIQDYSQGLASTEYGNAWNRATNNRDFSSGLDRYDQQFNYNAAVGDRNYDYGRLRDLAQFGLQASGQEAQSQNALAGILASIMQNGGQIAGTGQIGAGNAINGGIGSILSWLLSQQAMGGAT